MRATSSLPALMQFFLYCICGGIGVTTDYLVYYSAITFDIWYQIANLLGYFSGTLVSFLLNRRITFDVRDKMVHRFAMFMGVAAIGFSASALMLWIMVDVLSMDAKAAKILTLPVVVIIQFLMNRRVTFDKKLPNRLIG
jgi:putative flippase GtrA